MGNLGFGVIRLSVVPVRVSPADAAEIISQLLFGEHYRIVEISEDQKWLKIENAFDAYQGWIDCKQHHQISQEFFDQISDSDYRISTEPFSELTFEGQRHMVSFGTVLPLLSNSLFGNEEKIKFGGKAKSIYTKLSRRAIVECSKSLLNVPYLWGGRSSAGIDCSGFTQLLYRVGGYSLPRDSSQQILKGKEIELDKATEADLAFFTNHAGKMNHVGLVLNKQEIIHASGKVRIDKLDDNGIFNAELNEYTHHLLKIKTILLADH